jgi:hypothetical protein
VDASMTEEVPMSRKGDRESFEAVSLRWLVLDTMLTLVERSLALFKKSGSWGATLRREALLRLRFSTWGELMSDPVRMDTVVKYMDNYVHRSLRRRWVTELLLSEQFSAFCIDGDAHEYWQILTQVPIPSSEE